LETSISEQIPDEKTQFLNRKARNHGACKPPFDWLASPMMYIKGMATSPPLNIPFDHPFIPVVAMP
jgi:hypothetical protein